MRSKSPRSPAVQQKRILGSSPSRSKSVPNGENQSTPKSPCTTPRRNTQVDVTLDFFINEISSRQFFQTQTKKDLLNLAKNAKQTGNRYITSHTRSQVISTQFWNLMNTFQTQLNQELTKQISQSHHSLIRNLSSIRETVDSIKASKRFIDIQNRTNELVNQGNNISDNVDDILSLISEFRQFQTVLVHDDAVSRHQSLKYKLTSTISQILTLLRNIKDLTSFSNKSKSQFENDYPLLEDEIPKTIPEVSPKGQTTPIRRFNKSPTIGKSKSPSRTFTTTPQADKIRRKNENCNENNKNSSGNSNFNASGCFSKNDNEKKSNVEAFKPNNLKNVKNVFDVKRPKADNEIFKIQSQIAKLTQATNEDHDVKIERKPIQFQNQFNALSSLHSAKKDLDFNTIFLNAITKSLIEQLPEKNVSIYTQNYDLRKQRNLLNKQLFSLKIDILHMNQISQRATMHPEISGDEDDINELKEEYYIELDSNKNYRQKLKSLQKEYDDLELKFINILQQKYSHNEHDDNVATSYKNAKENYRSKMSQIMQQQLSLQNEASTRLMKNTDASLIQLNQKFIKESKSIESKKQAINNEYEEIQELYEAAIDNNEETIQYGTEILEIDEAEMILSDLSKQYHEISKQSEQLEKNTNANKEKIINAEKEQLDNSNNSILKWISQMKKQSVDMNINLQSLLMQYELMEKLVNEKSFDLKTGFIDVIEKVKKKNQSLRNKISSSIQEIVELDKRIGGSNENISFDQRLKSIVNHLTEAQ